MPGLATLSAAGPLVFSRAIGSTANPAVNSGDTGAILSRAATVQFLTIAETSNTGGGIGLPVDGASRAFGGAATATRAASSPPGSNDIAACTRASCPAATTTPSSRPSPRADVSAKTVYVPGSNPVNRKLPFLFVIPRASTPVDSFRTTTVAPFSGAE
jgi:hypothetical protein